MFVCLHTVKEKQQKNQYRIWYPALRAHASEAFWEIWTDGTDHGIVCSQKLQTAGQMFMISITAQSHGSLTAKVFRNWKQMNVTSTTTQTDF